MMSSVIALGMPGYALTHRGQALRGCRRPSGVQRAKRFCHMGSPSEKQRFVKRGDKPVAQISPIVMPYNRFKAML